MGTRNYEVSPEAIADARYYGVGGKLALRLKRMATRSAPLTHERGNRRFGPFWLKVEGTTVRQMGMI